MAPIELDPIPEPDYPVGSELGSSEGAGNSYERAAGELLHRPHAFALMHGDGGVKVAYGELHYRVDSFELTFNQQDLTCTIADHADHSHADHAAHAHTLAHTHNLADHYHGCGDCGSGSGSSNTGGVTSGSFTTTSQSTENTSTQSAFSHSGVKDVSDGSSTAPSAVLSHTCTISPAQITYCSEAKQAGIGNITQVTPKIGPEPEDYTPPAEGEEDAWPDMDPTIPSIYHQLVGYGDVYLCWKVDTENVANEVEKCWVQVGAPDGNPIGGITTGTTTTDRRAAGDPKAATGQPEGDDEGVYKIKLGTVNIDSQITQNVSNDVSWNTVVMDRFLTTNSP